MLVITPVKSIIIVKYLEELTFSQLTERLNLQSKRLSTTIVFIILNSSTRQTNYLDFIIKVKIRRVVWLQSSICDMNKSPT